jgi:hypothetical protein
MRTSPDRAVSWTSAATISGANVTARDDMVGVVNTGESMLLTTRRWTEWGCSRFTP